MKYLFIAMLWLPFVLLTDLFPLMRFGMFAEPIKTASQTEIFIVSSHIENVESDLTEKQIGIKTENFNYLARNYHYKKQEKILLQTLAKTLKLKSSNRLNLKKVIINSAHRLSDTSIVFTYIQP